ncbi:MAG: hypothetical protein JRN34_00630 [Nitrososphaerota archaeon]|jgi:hypothetical protein|nr:hypothetical protein [Nitrososphaerota archaeon]MDG6943090.1 hypothetical protein [Nitrososphaerota archaeon]
MKLRSRGTNRTPINFAAVILGAYALALFLFAILIRFAVVPDSISLVESLKPSPYGIGVGSYSLGYVSVFVLGISTLLAVWGRKGRGIVSTPGAIAVFLLGTLLASSFSAVSFSIAPSKWVYSVQDSAQGFTLIVSYNSTVVTQGTNLTIHYALTDNSYTLSTPYYLFGGQFSMVFYNSTGKQVVAFRAPITFTRNASQYTVQLQPGEVWSTNLEWDGLIVPTNASSYMAPPGAYTLSSYAVLQDANASLYVVLNPHNIPITVSL